MEIYILCAGWLWNLHYGLEGEWELVWNEIEILTIPTKLRLIWDFMQLVAGGGWEIIVSIHVLINLSQTNTQISYPHPAGRICEH